MSSSDAWSAQGTGPDFDWDKVEGLLQDARAVLVEGHAKYGPADKVLRRIAELWAVYLGRPLDEHDVAMMMALLKVGRIASGSSDRDNVLDAVGYLALASGMDGR